MQADKEKEAMKTRTDVTEVLNSQGLAADELSQIVGGDVAQKKVSGGTAQPSESLSLNFTKVEWSY